jgi:hypothetical protein
MQKRKLLLAALAVSSIGVIPFTASAASIIVTEAPPAPRYEVVPAERHGYVWAPGYWDYRHGHYVWTRGHWVREHRGMYWHPHRWEQRDGRWVMEGGRWDRERYVQNRPMGDRDRDGIPNRADRDRDGDGVPNRFDRAPDNPRRQ